MRIEELSIWLYVFLVFAAVSAVGLTITDMVLAKAISRQEKASK